VVLVFLIQLTAQQLRVAAAELAVARMAQARPVEPVVAELAEQTITAVQLAVPILAAVVAELVQQTVIHSVAAAEPADLA
jgi:hypothetical protein